MVNISERVSKKPGTLSQTLKPWDRIAKKKFLAERNCGGQQ